MNSAHWQYSALEEFGVMSLAPGYSWSQVAYAARQCMAAWVQVKNKG